MTEGELQATLREAELRGVKIGLEAAAKALDDECGLSSQAVVIRAIDPASVLEKTKGDAI